MRRLAAFVFGFFAAMLNGVMTSERIDAFDEPPVRVFIFAGQSNIEGADSHVRDIDRFPPFEGLGLPQEDVLFSYCIGRENKEKSDGWVELQPVREMVGPELSFARRVGSRSEGRIAIIKVAAGGTHLGGDWNPDEPSGFEMYPLLIETVNQSLKELTDRGLEYRLEGMMWHQGENDMFNEDYMASYGANLSNFMMAVRRDLQVPDLKFYVGELCTKTIWGMDLRPRMYAISLGQRAATNADPLAEYIPTAHVGVEIGRDVGLHYHYGTLGQLEHGVNYADAYLRTIGITEADESALTDWPYPEGSSIKLFVLAGHRNMEGERAFVQQLQSDIQRPLKEEVGEIAYRYSLGGGYKTSTSWEPLRPAGYYDTFGPELSFAHTVRRETGEQIAIAKFTHSGSQIIDWTPEGSEAESRNLYPAFVEFVEETIRDLSERGHEVELAGIFYHIGENDMSFYPYRAAAAERVSRLIDQSRKDLELPTLDWYLSQQPPTDHENLNRVDVVANFEALAESDDHVIHVQAFDLPEQEKQLVLNTEGIIELGFRLAVAFLQRKLDVEAN